MFYLKRGKLFYSALHTVVFMLLLRYVMAGRHGIKWQAGGRRSCCACCARHAFLQAKARQACHGWQRYAVLRYGGACRQERAAIIIQIHHERTEPDPSVHPFEGLRKRWKFQEGQ